MSYKLTQELRIAGFPLKLAAGNYISPVPLNYMSTVPLINISSHNHGSWCEEGKICDGHDYLPPTLSELIEACGWITLVGLEGHDWQAQGGRMEINKDTMQGGYTTYAKGKTPEEAVAKLWLKLNKK